MAIIRITYKTKTNLVSCLPDESELQAGEQVKIRHNSADPRWSSYIKAHLAIPACTEDGDRVYLLDFDDAQLNGGMTPTFCDLYTPECWSCCNANAERLENLIDALKLGGVLTENEDKTFNYIG